MFHHSSSLSLSLSLSLNFPLSLPPSLSPQTDLQLFHGLLSEADGHHEINDGCKLIEMEVVAISDTGQGVVEGGGCSGIKPAKCLVCVCVRVCDLQL